MSKIRYEVFNPKQKFEKFSQNVIKTVSRNAKLSQSDFINQLKDVGDIFVKNNQQDIMNKCSQRLAETLVNQKCLELAGIVYSYLIKFNKGNQVAVEKFATNALIIAKRLHDPVHTMARANDLKEIYRYTQPNSDKHLSVLFDESKALNSIVKNYDSAKRRYNSANTEMKPVERYEEKLAAIKIEIAEVLINRKQAGAAQKELREALEIYERIGKGANSMKAENLLQDLGV